MADIDVGTAFAAVSILLAAVIWLAKEVRDQWGNNYKLRACFFNGFLLLATFFGYFLCVMLTHDLADSILIYPVFAMTLVFGIILLAAPILTFVPDSYSQVKSSFCFLLCHIVFITPIIAGFIYTIYTARPEGWGYSIAIAATLSIVIFVFGMVEPKLETVLRRHTASE